MEKRLLFQLSKTQEVMTRYIKDQIRQRGLNITRGQMGILFLLKKDRELAMGDISARLDMDNGAATRLVDKLWEKKLVTRNPDADDRRRWMVSLTPEGLKKANESRDLVISINKKIKTVLSEEEEEFMLAITGRLYHCFHE